MTPDPRERLRRLAADLELESGFLEQCVRFEAVRLEDLLEGPAEPAPCQLARLRRLQRICRGLEIDVLAGCVILDLLDRLDGLQQELERTRSMSS